MFAPIPDEVIELILNAQAACGGTLPELLAPGAIGRFKALNDFLVAFAKDLGKHGGLRGFPGSVDTFNDNELSHVLRVVLLLRLT